MFREGRQVLDRPGPSVRTRVPVCARVEFRPVAIDGDRRIGNLPVSWRGGRRRAWPGPAAGGGSDRLNTRVPGTDQQLDRPPQQFLRDLNGRTGTGPHPKRIGSQEAPGR